MNEVLIPRMQALKSLMPRWVIRARAFHLDRTRVPGIANILSSNRGFKNKHMGQRCFILGNGPSLSKMDLGWLKDEVVFTCNRATQFEQYEKLESNYHIWMDERVLSQPKGSEEEDRIADIARRIKTNNHTPIAFFEASMCDFVSKHELDKRLPVSYVLGSHHYGFSPSDEIDLTKPLPHFPTVVHTAILIALYMGFSEIVLLGCDCTGFISIANAYSDNLLAQEQYCYGLDETDRAIIKNVFSNSSIAQELANYSEMIDTYRLIDIYCKNHNVKLVNATCGGLLEVLTRKSILDYSQK